jgi:hypothetical protein
MSTDPSTTKVSDFLERASAIIEKKWTGSKKCPICQSSQWSIGTMGAIPRNLREDGGEGMDFNNVFPTLPILCVTCGYTLFFNTIVAGITESPPEESSPDNTPAL